MGPTLINASAGWTPLYLSTLAGMSTALGAAVVFLHPVTYDENSKYPRRNVSPGTLCFSLALAGSVMVTVSVISIGPECLADPGNDRRWMSVLSWPFAQRALSFAAGWLLYVLLSKSFPEPEEIIEASLMADGVVAAGGGSSPLRVAGGANSGSGGAAALVEGGGIREGDVESGVGSPPKPSSYEAPDRLTPSPKKDSSRGRGQLVRRSDSSFYSARSTISDSDSEAAASAPLLERQSSKKGKKGGSSLSGGALTSMESFASFASGDDLGTRDQRRAWRVSMLLFVSLLCHNFPEGLAVCASALESDRLGLTVTVGIMIHNIPEGIAIAIPCLAARPEYPWLSFLLASFSGLAEPFGAFVALIFLRRLPVGGGTESGEDPDAALMLSLENVLAFVAGIMMAVSICELFPEARRHIKGGNMHYYSGLISGVLVMVATELYLPS